MDIQVRTDYHVAGDQGLVEYVEQAVSHGLEPYAPRITGAKVHLAQESGARKGVPELRCVLEVRVSGHGPVAVTRRASTKDAALRGAVADLRALLDRTLGRLDRGHVGAETIRRPAARRR